MGDSNCTLMCIGASQYIDRTCYCNIRRERFASRLFLDSLKKASGCKSLHELIKAPNKLVVNGIEYAYYYC